VFQKEFRTYNPAYYEASIRAGTITVNGQKVRPSIHTRLEMRRIDSVC
jgi:hypothetical protein